MAAEQPKARGTDWDAARDFWVALEPHRRSYEIVAREFSISSARVRFVAKRDGWRAVADDVDRRALEQAKRRIVRSRADRVQKTLGIVDGLLDRFDEELGQVDLRAADLDRVVKLAELLEGQATDRMEFSEIQAFVGAVVKIAAKFIARDRLQAFLDEIRGAAEQHDGDEQAAA